jgi:hypothetical protein
VRNVYRFRRTTADRRRLLQARGAFIQCNVTRAIGSLASESEDRCRKWMPRSGGRGAIVPALTWAVGMLQERGFTYELPASSLSRRSPMRVLPRSRLFLVAGVALAATAAPNPPESTFG